MKTLNRLTVVVFTLMIFACSDQQSDQATATTEAADGSESTVEDNRPNIVLIIADDLGYSDMGAFGGEIDTPNLDALAKAGKVLTHFHVGPTCSPTRAMLLSGTDAHRAGLGTMNGMQSEEQSRQPGYEGFLNKDIVTFVRLLKDAGYHTYMVGKWQQGYAEGYYPLDRGFERAFWLREGAASHYADMRGVRDKAPMANWYEDREPLQSLPEDFYSSVDLTDKMIEYIDSHRADGKPFFLYGSYTAPHWPLQAPQEYIDKYEGVYDGGYDVIRDRRIERMRAAGLIKDGQIPAPQHPEWPSWEQLSDEQKKFEIKRMQLYAAMVDALDENIGRLIQHLKDTGEYENTFLLFFSDNGADGGNPRDISADPAWLEANFDNRYDNMGKPGSFVFTGPGWAHVSSTPFQLYKGFPTQGGLMSPTIAVFPGRIAAGSRTEEFATILDIAPTLLELANISHPAPEYDGRNVHPLIGKSLNGFLSGEKDAVHADEYVYGLELFNKRMIRQGDWKLLWLNQPWGEGDWALYNVAGDSGEQHDLAASNPDKLKEMLQLWEEYVEQNNVFVAEDIQVKYTNTTSHYD